MHETNIAAAVEELFARLGQGSESAAVCFIIAAHPDDEVIGAGILLSGMTALKPWVIHTTDGAPDTIDSSYCGLQGRAAYASQRRKELYQALSLAGILPGQCVELKLQDQQATRNLEHLTIRLMDLIAERRPSVIFTHGYEGGHPDHDATCFGVQAAVKKIVLSGHRPRPSVFEFLSYHASGDGMAVDDFLSNRQSCAEPVTLHFTKEQQQLKKSMLACFSSQRHVVASFSVAYEKFRLSPLYDFTQPPHEGTLFYENFNWGMTGRQWRTRAAQALDSLGLSGRP